MTPQALRLRPDLLADLREAVAWYEAASPGLGAKFQQAFFTELDHIASTSQSYRTLYRDFRRAIMPRFPYLIYFKVEANTAIIFLLIHSARDPAVTRPILRQR